LASRLAFVVGLARRRATASVTARSWIRMRATDVATSQPNTWIWEE
jgi:hypothetical protein